MQKYSFVRTQKLATSVKMDFFQITALLLKTDMYKLCMYFTFLGGTPFSRNVKLCLK